MPTYIMLTKLTTEGRKTVREHPLRITQVNEEIEHMGARVVHQYAVLGPYDFVNILEAPDNETIARVSVELGSRGTIEITTLAAIRVEEFQEGLLQGRRAAP